MRHLLRPTGSLKYLQLQVNHLQEHGSKFVAKMAVSSLLPKHLKLVVASCAAIMNSVASVVDGSCTTCDGAASSTCSAATCASGYHTFVDGVGCSGCASACSATEYDI